jgi:PAS domain S-box-containing protein
MSEGKIQLLERRFIREKLARKEAERILEEKAIELFNANSQLKSLNESLESQVEKGAEDLRVSRLRYKNFIETAKEIIYETTSKGYITYANPFASTLLSFSNKEFVGKHFLSFVAHDYRDVVIEHYLECVINNEANSYLEIPILKKNKDLLWVGQSVTFDYETCEGKRQLVGVQAIARDITAQHYAQRKLELSEEKYRSIMENMELGFLEVDLHGKIVKAYDRFCQMTGYTDAELTGQDAVEVLLPDEYINLMEKNDESREDGVISSYEVELVKKDKGRIWVLISGGPVFNEKGETIGSVGIHYDISEQKRIQTELLQSKQIAEAAQRSEKQFLANISHEIRTPLNAIIGMSHLLYDANPTAEQKDYLEMIKYSANFLHSLISDVLDVSKIEAGEVELQKSKFDMHKLLRTIHKTFQLKVTDRNIGIDLTIDDSVNQFYTGDEVLLNQVLMNLVGNAEKFTLMGTVKIVVSSVLTDEKNANLSFKISDSGIGIDANKLSDIFKKFKQVHRKNETNTKETGLGLAIVKQLLNLLQGDIAVSSELGVGTTFTVIIPYLLYVQPNDQTTEAQAVEAVKNITELKILIVEDNRINQRYAGAVLKRLSIDFDIANNGKIACDLSDERDYDMILMDIQMPVMNGYEAARYIRNSDSSNKSIPIIALTAWVMAIEHNKAIASGMNEILSKPFTPDQLRIKIEQYYVPAKEKVVPETLIVLNDKIIQEVYDGDVEFQRIVFDSFVEEIPDQVASLQTAYSGRNLQKIAAVSHQIKPTFGMVGLSEYQVNLGRIERVIKHQSKLPKLEEQLLVDFFADLPKIMATMKKTLEQLK